MQRMQLAPAGRAKHRSPVYGRFATSGLGDMGVAELSPPCGGLNVRTRFRLVEDEARLGREEGKLDRNGKDVLGCSEGAG